jgi:hypothetical protein
MSRYELLKNSSPRRQINLIYGLSPQCWRKLNGVVAPSPTSQAKRKHILKALFLLAGKLHSVRTEIPQDVSTLLHVTQHRNSFVSSLLYDHASIHLNTLQSCDQLSDSFTLKMEVATSSATFLPFNILILYIVTVYTTSKYGDIFSEDNRC